METMSHALRVDRRWNEPSGCAFLCSLLSSSSAKDVALSLVNYYQVNYAMASNVAVPFRGYKLSWIEKEMGKHVLDMCVLVPLFFSMCLVGMGP